MKKTNWFYVTGFFIGASIWIAIAIHTGKHEAWDSGLYFSVAIPLICLVAAIQAFFIPERSWRWAVIPFAGQFFSMLVMQGVGSLLPLGIIAFAIFSLPAVVAARLGTYFGKRYRQN